MKKRFFKVSMILAITASFMCTSCIGSFTTFNKLKDWNQTVGNKFVNELVFFVFWVIPVYEVATLADLVVFNSIEFWTNENPMAKGKKMIQGENDRYLVECDGKGYTITAMTEGRSMRLDFDATDKSWNVALPEGESYKLMTFVDDTHVALPTPDGGSTVVELSQAGLYAYQAVVANPLMAMK